MKKHILITGGCGFIGCNAALYFLNKGWFVTILDNLSRAGTEKNLLWLQKQGEFQFLKADIRNNHDLEPIFKNHRFDYVLHLAAQVAVTTSVVNPREDFEINALGSFNILENIRLYQPKCFSLFASTNKVYGKLEDVFIKEDQGRYIFSQNPHGISEARALDFHSPYGCSKGTADQYFIDYSRIYNLKTAVFRQSCIYGIRQFGIEDQGWVAWFTIAALLDKNISIFGDGKQVRDVLFAEDLIRAYEMAFDCQEQVNGHAFNIGGGPKNTLSLIELLGHLEKKLNKKLTTPFLDWRPGDQKVYISDISKFQKFTGWTPQVSPHQGVERLVEWVHKSKAELIETLKIS